MMANDLLTTGSKKGFWTDLSVKRPSVQAIKYPHLRLKQKKMNKLIITMVSDIHIRQAYILHLNISCKQ